MIIMGDDDERLSPDEVMEKVDDIVLVRASLWTDQERNEAATGALKALGVDNTPEVRASLELEDDDARADARAGDE